MNRQGNSDKRIKAILSLLVVITIALTSTVQALASSGGHAENGGTTFGPSKSNDDGTKANSFYGTSYGGYKVSLLYIGKDRYLPEALIDGEESGSKGNSSDDGWGDATADGSESGSGEYKPLIENITPYSVTGNSYYYDKFFTNENYLGYLAIGSVYFVNGNCKNEMGVRANKDGKLELGRYKNALNGKIITDHSQITAVIEPGDTLVKDKKELQEDIYNAFKLPDYSFNNEYSDSIGLLEMTSILDVKDAKPEELAHNKSVLKSILTTMLKGYKKNSNTAKFIQEYGLDVINGANTESEFILLVEPIIEIRYTDSTGKNYTPYMITVNNYCVGCSRGANNEKGYLSFPKEAVNFDYYLDNMYNDSERKEVKLGSINYFLGYQTKSKDGKSYPNGNMDGPEKQKKQQTFITRCSYTGWMSRADEGKTLLRRGTGFTTKLEKTYDDYKWGFGTLASRDALGGGDPSPAVMSSTNLSLISDAGIPIINTGLFGKLADGEFGDVENLDTPL